MVLPGNFIIKLSTDLSPNDLGGRRCPCLHPSRVPKGRFVDPVPPSALVSRSSSIKKDFSLIDFEIQLAQEGRERSLVPALCRSLE